MKFSSKQYALNMVYVEKRTVLSTSQEQRLYIQYCTSSMKRPTKPFLRTTLKMASPGREIEWVRPTLPSSLFPSTSLIISIVPAFESCPRNSTVEEYLGLNSDIGPQTESINEGTEHRRSSKPEILANTAITNQLYFCVKRCCHELHV